jgi:hypothetical protein
MLKLDFTLGHGGVASIAIYDETGSAVKQVLNGMRPGGMNELSADLSNIPSGHYFVRLASGTDVITKELIVQHSKIVSILLQEWPRNTGAILFIVEPYTDSLV